MSLSSQFDKGVGEDVFHHPSTISGVTHFDSYNKVIIQSHHTKAHFDSSDTVLKVMCFLYFQRRNQPCDAYDFSAVDSLATESVFS